MTLTKSLDMVKAGDKAPDFNLKGIDGKNHSLSDFKDAKALLILFMCNHCPYVIAKQQMIVDLQAKYKDKGLVVVGINSNESESEKYAEDNFDGMVKTAQEKGFNFVYLHDETQEVAKAYGASCTPDPFLFDSEQKLVYHGRLNNQMEPDDEVTENDMGKAVEAVLAGNKSEHEFLFSLGCSIKWKN
jgi:peroxiredoxin